MCTYIDLHIHSNKSDGSMSPKELVNYALKKKIKVISLTDHDNVDGIEEAINEGNLLGIEVIPGVELTIDYRKQMHILGYFTKKRYLEVKKELDRYNLIRIKWTMTLIKELNKVGINITASEVKDKYKILQLKNISKILVEKDYVANSQEAYDKYLNNDTFLNGRPKGFSIEKGFEIIKNAGGLVVLAHPIYLESDIDKLEVIINELINLGLDGIEVYYPEYNGEVSKEYIYMAEKYNLIVTGGSDFHGKNKIGIDLGVGKGALKVPITVSDIIKNNLVNDILKMRKENV